MFDRLAPSGPMEVERIIRIDFPPGERVAPLTKSGIPEIPAKREFFDASADI
jgi:hypothetical protein